MNEKLDLITKRAKKKYKTIKIKSNTCGFIHIGLIILFLYVLFGTDIVRGAWREWRFNESFSYIGIYGPLAIFILTMGLTCLLLNRSHGGIGAAVIAGAVMVVVQSVAVCVWIGQNDNSLGWFDILMLALLLSFLSAVPGTIFLFIISKNEDTDEMLKNIQKQALKQKAELGDMESQYAYSELLENEGNSEGIIWLEKAADQGHSGAKEKLRIQAEEKTRLEAKEKARLQELKERTRQELKQKARREAEERIGRDTERSRQRKESSKPSAASSQSSGQLSTEEAIRAYECLLYDPDSSPQQKMVAKIALESLRGY